MKKALRIGLVGILLAVTSWSQDDKFDLFSGVITLAAKKLSSDKKEEKAVGGQLLRFCSEMRPQSDEVTILRGKVKRNLKIEASWTDEDKKKLVAGLSKVIGQSRSETFTLMLWSIMEVADPGNEKAILAIDKAGAAGVKTDLDSLIAKYKEESQAKADAGCPKCKGTHKCPNPKCRDGVVTVGGYDNKLKKFGEHQEECPVCKGTGLCSCYKPADWVQGLWTYQPNNATHYCKYENGQVLWWYGNENTPPKKKGTYVIRNDTSARITFPNNEIVELKLIDKGFMYYGRCDMRKIR